MNKFDTLLKNDVASVARIEVVSGMNWRFGTLLCQAASTLLHMENERAKLSLEEVSSKTSLHIPRSASGYDISDVRETDGESQQEVQDRLAELVHACELTAFLVQQAGRYTEAIGGITKCPHAWRVKSIKSPLSALRDMQEYIYNKELDLAAVKNTIFQFTLEEQTRARTNKLEALQLLAQERFDSLWGIIAPHCLGFHKINDLEIHEAEDYLLECLEGLNKTIDPDRLASDICKKVIAYQRSRALEGKYVEPDAEVKAVADWFPD